MNKLFISIMLLANFAALSQEKKVSNEEKISKEICTYIKNQDVDAMHNIFNADLKEQLNSDKLKGFLGSLNTTYGKYKRAIDFNKKIIAEGVYFHQGIAFEKQSFDLIFSLDENYMLSSFRLTGYTDKKPWKAPDYVDENSFETVNIQIGEEKPLLGEYTQAKTAEKVIVVFVHGSGANNMNERLGPNELFKDLAYGLASNGISSIRYNKRTYDYPSSLMKNMKSLTIGDIVVNDAIEAIKKAKELGASKIILLGHSLGGHLAPKIANQEDVNGVIVMAGNASPLEDLIIPQFEYIMENDTSSGITEFQLNIIKQQVKTLKEKDYDENTAGMALPFGMPGVFWKSLQDNDPVKIAKKHKFPYLILNGERDYQVTTEEAKKWKNGSKHPLSETIIYPRLNHMFFEGYGICIPSEYEYIGHLNSVVLNDITEWIAKL